MITETQVKAAVQAYFERTAFENCDVVIVNGFRRSLEAAEAAAWQPMDSAPTDNTPFQAWHAKYAMPISVRDAGWSGYLENATNPGHVFGRASFTAWRPMPGGPK